MLAKSSLIRSKAPLSMFAAVHISVGLFTMSESEHSLSELNGDALQADAVEQPEQSDTEGPELQSVEEATAVLRSCWKFAAVIQVTRMFAAPLRLKAFAADILESALISPDNHRMFLSELLFKLLRADALQPYSEKDSEGWESLLYRKMSAKWAEHFDSHPLAGTTFYDITPTKRVCRCRLACSVSVSVALSQPASFLAAG